MPEKSKADKGQRPPPPPDAKVATPVEEPNHRKDKPKWAGNADGPYVLVIKSKHYQHPDYRKKVTDDMRAATEAAGQPMPALLFFPADDLIKVVDKDDNGVPRLLAIRSTANINEPHRGRALADIRAALQAGGRPLPAVYFLADGEYMENPNAVS